MQTCLEQKVMDTLPDDVWIARCAMRIVEVDSRIDAAEAEDIARNLRSFERTAAMEPEQAVDFVAAELARGQRTKFERRATPRK
jgi:hypothetical protein